MSNVEKSITQQLMLAVDHDLAAITPGLCLQVYQGGRKKVDLRFGKTWKYYDLASLTKILFSVSVLMNMGDRKLIKVENLVSAYLSDWPHAKVTLKQLLTHSAGMPWWGAFYKKLKGPKDPLSRWQELRRHLMRVKRTGQRKSIYSDLDLMVLGFVMTDVLGQDLETIWNLHSERVGIEDFHFNIHNKPTYARHSYAPTESCPWRKKVLRGEVHDENTWALGGIAPHAGLFGTIDSVSQWGLELRRAMLKEKGSALGSHKTVSKFTRRSITKDKGDWALGFMMPTPGQTSAGQFLSPKSVGHTGFTGTSLWFDPVHDLLVVALSNRVHPTRKNAAFVSLRPVIHDIVFQKLMV